MSDITDQSEEGGMKDLPTAAELRAVDGCRVIIFQWSEQYGDCYDCGAPAAFERESGDASPDERLCAVCAANAAADGEVIHRIDGQRWWS